MCVYCQICVLRPPLVIFEMVLIDRWSYYMHLHTK